MYTCVHVYAVYMSVCKDACVHVYMCVYAYMCAVMFVHMKVNFSHFQESSFFLFWTYVMTTGLALLMYTPYV